MSEDYEAKYYSIALWAVNELNKTTVELQQILAAPKIDRDRLWQVLKDLQAAADDFGNEMNAISVERTTPGETDDAKQR